MQRVPAGYRALGKTSLRPDCCHFPPSPMGHDLSNSGRGPCATDLEGIDGGAEQINSVCSVGEQKATKRRLIGW